VKGPEAKFPGKVHPASPIPVFIGALGPPAGIVDVAGITSKKCRAALRKKWNPATRWVERDNRRTNYAGLTRCAFHSITMWAKGLPSPQFCFVLALFGRPCHGADEGGKCPSSSMGRLPKNRDRSKPGHATSPFITLRPFDVGDVNSGGWLVHSARNPISTCAHCGCARGRRHPAKDKDCFHKSFQSTIRTKLSDGATHTIRRRSRSSEIRTRRFDGC